MSTKPEVIDFLSKLPVSHNGLPEYVWSMEDGSFLHLEFMVHNSGCWPIISNRHSGVETGRINLGTYTSVESIIALIVAITPLSRYQCPLTESS